MNGACAHSGPRCAGVLGMTSNTHEGTGFLRLSPGDEGCLPSAGCLRGHVNQPCVHFRWSVRYPLNVQVLMESVGMIFYRNDILGLLY